MEIREVVNRKRRPQVSEAARGLSQFSFKMGTSLLQPHVSRARADVGPILLLVWSPRQEVPGCPVAGDALY